MLSARIHKITRMIAPRFTVLNHLAMGRKLTDEEFADPDFQALFVALEKAAKPVTVKVAERRRASVARAAQERPNPKTDRSPPQRLG